MLLPFELPIQILVCGSTGSGKSTLIRELIKRRHECLFPVPDKIYYFCKHESSVDESIRNLVIIHVGLPKDDFFDNKDVNKHYLGVFDDLHTSCLNSEFVLNCVISGRHLNLSTIVVLHSLFPKAKFAREISLNSRVLILFANKRDGSQIFNLARQVCPLESGFLSKVYFSYINTTSHSYIVIDCRESVKQEFRFRTNIFDESPIIFLSEKSVERLKNEKDTSAEAQLPFYQFL
ncbi:hypothetical protein PVAND_017626 [Polypedilum vanderplanki]|uniref:Uncharacterized protein n=1 Tax=Polypedilum vanderplanki TaxID=319348 RepID=A0A9J6B970_POLVA|nr:hypothetical protein PVAND_017626 [Polypedilum vanderplanki]